MNILFLTTHFNTGGITSYILTLGEALVKAGHRVIVVSSGGDSVPALEAAGMRHEKLIIRTKSEVHPALWLSLGRLNDLVKKEKIDIIHAQTRVTQVLGVALSRLSGVPMVTTCHGFFKPRWFRRAFPCWGNAAIAISKPVARHLVKDLRMPQESVYLIPNGIDLERFGPSSDEIRRQARERADMSGKKVIGIIARLSSVKGIDNLIKAMPLVLEKVPVANLMIVGQGPEEAALKKLTLEMSLTDQVHFKNITDQAQYFLPAFDVFAMPSLMEGLGLSVIEAQACGIPVVASRVGGLIDLIEDGKSGYLVPSNNIQALAGRIIEMLLNPQQARLMAQAARLNVEKNFSAEFMLKKTFEVYEQYSRR